jgi:hypothetical protein
MEIKYKPAYESLSKLKLGLYIAAITACAIILASINLTYPIPREDSDRFAVRQNRIYSDRER